MRTASITGKGACLALIMLAALMAAADPPARAASDPQSQAALAWLELVDQGDYQQSWQTAGRILRRAVSAQAWATQVGAVRPPFGKVLSRKEASRQHHKQLPGAPDGDYLIFTFHTKFAKKAKGVETLTLQREADGAWRTVGYYIR